MKLPLAIETPRFFLGPDRAAAPTLRVGAGAYREVVDVQRHGSAMTVASQAAIVRAMWLAHREDRIDEMLEYLHPRVLWRPMFRPGRSLYEGHDGLRMMLADARAATGVYWIELDDIAEIEASIVRALGRVVALDESGDTTETAIEFLIAFRDGLIHDVETLPRGAPSSRAR